MRPIDADFAREKVNLLGGGAPWSTESVLAMLEACPTIVQPPNDPLTLEELWEMDGEPVWDKSGNCFIVRTNVHGTEGYGADKFATYTKLYILCKRGIYRRKPEEGA